MLVPSLSMLMTTAPISADLMVWVGGRYVGGDVLWETVAIEDAGGNVRGVTRFQLQRALADLPEIVDQAQVRVYDAVEDAEVALAYVTSRYPTNTPRLNQVTISGVDHASLLDDAWIERDWRPPEDVTNRLAYLWAFYAGSALAGDQSYVTITSGLLPAQGFAGVSLREAIESTIQLASATADYHVDALGYLHAYEGEQNGAPRDVTDGSGIERLILVAHRGDINPVDGFPENTEEAIDQSVAKGADRLEIDCQRSADGTWYLMHDTTVDRTTDGTGTITAMTDAAINALNIDGGYGYNAGRHGTTLNVPTLALAIAGIGSTIEVEFDLKETTNDAAAALAAWIVDNFDPARSLINTEGVSRGEPIKRVAPTIRTVNEWAGEDNAYIDIWQVRHSDLTSPATVATKLPKRTEVFFGIEDYGLSETSQIVNTWSWGGRSFLTNNLDAALTDRSGLYSDRPEIGPMDLSVDFDSGRYANRVYIQGATAAASGFYADGAAIAKVGFVRTVSVSAPEVETTTAAQSVATSLLRRLTAAEPRGSFTTIEGSGWRYGQRVRVSHASAGPTGDLGRMYGDAYPFRVARVATSVIRPGTSLQLAYDVEFGASIAGGER